MGALTKQALVEYLVTGNVMVVKDAKYLVDQFYEELRSCLARGEQVKLSGFGNFNLRDKSARPGRNPKTLEPVEISARRVVTFTAGQKFRARVESYEGNTTEGDCSDEKT